MSTKKYYIKVFDDYSSDKITYTIMDISDNSEIIARLANLYTKKLIIMFISDLKIANIKPIEIKNSLNLKLIKHHIYIRKIFIDDLIYNLIQRPEILKNTIFIFKNATSKSVVLGFRSFDIIISGGSVCKRHLLSPIQLRLARFIIAIKEESEKGVVNTFLAFAFGTKQMNLVKVVNKFYIINYKNYINLFFKKVLLLFNKISLNIKYNNLRFSFSLPLILNYLKIDIPENAEPIINYSFGVFLLSLICLLCFINVIGYLSSIILLSKYNIDSKFPRLK